MEKVTMRQFGKIIDFCIVMCYKLDYVDVEL